MALSALRTDNDQLPWRIRIIVERSSNTAIGSINLKGPPDVNGDVEVGWGLNEAARGKGYATEAAAAVMQSASQQSGVHSVSATIPDDNTASQAVAERLGMSRTGTTRRNQPLWRFEKTNASKGG